MMLDIVSMTRRTISAVPVPPAPKQYISSTKPTKASVPPPINNKLSSNSPLDDLLPTTTTAATVSKRKRDDVHYSNVTTASAASVNVVEKSSAKRNRPLSQSPPEDPSMSSSSSSIANGHSTSNASIQALDLEPILLTDWNSHYGDIRSNSDAEKYFHLFHVSN
jgi:hypothetical protein